MLVLTRKSEQKIVIGTKNKKIVITILKVHGDQVSVGIEASKETPIYRQELFEEIEEANAEGAVNEEMASAGVKSHAQNIKIQPPKKSRFQKNKNLTRAKS